MNVRLSFLILFVSIQVSGIRSSTSSIKPPLALRTNSTNNNHSMKFLTNNDYEKSNSIPTSTVYFHQSINTDSDLPLVFQHQHNDNNGLSDLTGNNNNNNNNFSSSETRNYYNHFDPWSSLDQFEDGSYGSNGAHYPPIPMDVVEHNNDKYEDNPQNDEDDYEDDESDGNPDEYGGYKKDADHESDDNGMVNKNYNSKNAQIIIDEIDGDIAQQENADNDGGGGNNASDDFDIWNNEEDGPDPEKEFDQDNSASFNIPRINLEKNCKTVYKEIKKIPEKAEINGANNFKELFFIRKRRNTDSFGENKPTSSYILTRECHFTDNNKNDDNKSVRNSKVGPRTEESRYIPINIERSMKNAQQAGIKEFHPYPYPHHHIYYDGKLKRVRKRMDNVNYNGFPITGSIKDSVNDFPMNNFQKQSIPLLKNGQRNGIKKYSTSFNYYRRQQPDVPIQASQYQNRVPSNVQTNNDYHDYNIYKKNDIFRQFGLPLVNDDSYDDGNESGDDGDDYSVNYGGANYDSYENSYDSKDHDGKDGGYGGHDGGGHNGGDYEEYSDKDNEYDDGDDGKQTSDYYYK